MKDKIQRRINLFKELADDNQKQVEKYINRGWDYDYNQGRMDAYNLVIEALEELMLREAKK